MTTMPEERNKWLVRIESALTDLRRETYREIAFLARADLPPPPRQRVAFGVADT